ncbi:ABC transporter substrate-binding protein [Actinokineospora sp. HUAS TT18]|uniref:ABC transporter substrate-binding protein n=1 Tax=Actinokineospora sp. HUAS TT18 TaxID=3447451 RepID=UPI003F51D89D
MMRPISVMLQYFHAWPNDAGMVIARQLGWYRDVGLDVRFCFADFAHSRPTDYLARGEVDIAIAPSSRLLRHRAAGDRLVAVAAVNQVGLEAIQTTAASGIRRPRDLEGRRVACNPTPRSTGIVLDAVTADGGQPSAVEFVDFGLREVLPEELDAVGADASFGGYWVWDTLRTRLLDHEHVVMPIDGLGVPRHHSYVIVVREDLVEHEAILVRTFLEITKRGYLFAISETSAALDSFEPAAPFLPRPLITRSFELVRDTWLHKGRWGAIRHELLEPYARRLAAWGALPDESVWRAAVCTDF